MNTRRRTAMMKHVASLEQKFVKVINQINILEKRLYDCCRRRDAARMRGQHHFVYSLTLRMGVTEGVINVLYEYARHLSTEVRDLRWLLYQEIFIVVRDDDDVSDDDVISGDEEMMDTESLYLEIPL